MLTAYSRFERVYFSGYFNPNVITQKFTCQKIVKNGLGRAIENMGEVKELTLPLQNSYEIIKTAETTQKLLKTYEGYKDLDHWIEYVIRFGVARKIPRYDKMSIVKLYNLDLLGIASAVLLVIYLIISTCLRCLCGSKKQKQKKE